MMEVQSVHEPEWVTEKRNRALERYKVLEWPNLRYGTTIRADYSGLNTEQLSFGNGRVESLPSHDEAIVLPLMEAARRHPELVKPYLFDYFEIKHKFHALHAAYWRSGLFIHIPPHTELEKPIVIDRNVLSNSIHHVLVVCGEGSKASIIAKHSSLDKPLFSSSAVEAIVKHGAKLTFAAVQNFSKEVYNFDYKTAHVEQDAKMEWLDFCFGSKFTHSDVESRLNSSGAESNIKGIFFGDGEQQFDIGARSIHAAPHTVSDIAGKGVLSGKAKSIYRGLVKIENEAPSSDGYQKEDVLMLSEEAESNSIPQLEIDNNEVKCSHAATTSHVDNDQLFYLMSRGIGKEEATKLIVHGFLEPFIAQLPGQIADEIRAHVEGRLC